MHCKARRKGWLYEYENYGYIVSMRHRCACEGATPWRVSGERADTLWLLLLCARLACSFVRHI